MFKRTVLNLLTNRVASPLVYNIVDRGVPIYMIHRISSEEHPSEITSEYLHKCLQHLVNQGYRFLSLEELVVKMSNNEPVPDNSIVFTMDDGFLDQAEIASPIFLEYECPVTIFLITGMIDGRIWPWDDKISYIFKHTRKSHIELDLGNRHLKFELQDQQQRHYAVNKIRNLLKTLPADIINAAITDIAEKTEVPVPESPPEEYKPMSWGDARKYENMGVKFAPHTVNHYILSNTTDTQVSHEILESWNRLKNELTNPSPVFCYPTGRFFDFGPREVEILKQAGIKGAVSTIHSTVEINNRSEDYVFKLPRYSLSSDFNEFLHDISWLGVVRNKSILFEH